VPVEDPQELKVLRHRERAPPAPSCSPRKPTVRQASD
jgi:hypothetical protein